MPPATQIIPPAATLPQILRACCASGPQAEPALMQPWIGAGKRAGQVVTVATDGESLCVWTAGRVGRYQEWAALHPGLLRAGENAISPLMSFRSLFGGGGSHPLGLARRGKDGLWTMGILTGNAFLTDRQHQILTHCDTCYLGPSTLPLLNGIHQAISLRASIGKAVIHGVIRWLPPAPAAPAKKSAPPSTTQSHAR